MKQTDYPTIVYNELFTYFTQTHKSERESKETVTFGTSKQKKTIVHKLEVKRDHRVVFDRKFTFHQ